MRLRERMLVVGWTALLLGAATAAAAIDAGTGPAGDSGFGPASGPSRPKMAFRRVPGPSGERAAEPDQPPRLHLLIAADTLDETVGVSVQRDVTTILFAFVVNVPGAQLAMEVRRGEQVTRDELLSTIDRMAVGGGDSLVFYWSGHGAHDESGHWLQMRREPNLYRHELQRRMLAKHARLNVILSDCCNLVHPGKARPPIHAAPAIPRRVTPLFDALFFRSQGLADINAASENEAAMGTVDGGLFTRALACVPRDPAAREPAGFLWANRDRRLSWPAMVEDVGRQVRAAYEALGDAPPDQKTQTLKVWSLPTPVTTPPPTTTTTTTTEPPPPTGPARMVALRPGDLILAVNGRPVNSTAEYWHAVRQSQAAMRVRVQRGRSLAELQLSLRSGEGSRSGVAAETNPGGGVVVTQVYPGEAWPGNRAVVVRVGRGIRLEENDVIVSINGRRITSQHDYWSTVKSSPPVMRAEVVDWRTGRTLSLQAVLRSGEGSRFGVEAVENGGNGVRVTRVYPGYPGTRTEPID